VIRPAEHGDARAIADLERGAFGSDAWSHRLIAEGLSGDIPGALYLVACPPSHAPVETSVIGDAAASLFADVAELQRIAVAVTHRRTGIASALLERVVAEARARYADRLLLEVRDDNRGALAFYARRGFTELDRRPRYYADGTTAVVLAKEL